MEPIASGTVAQLSRQVRVVVGGGESRVTCLAHVSGCEFPAKGALVEFHQCVTRWSIFIAIEKQDICSEGSRAGREREG